MQSIFALIAITFTGTCFIWYKYMRSKVVSTGVQAQIILKSAQYNRQKPNAWLINTLSIVNPFTINNESLLKTFKNKVITTLSSYSDDTKYEKLISTIGSRIQYRLELLQSNNSKFNLSTFVKQVTLDSFLTGILNINTSEDLLTELPDLIIHLWKNRTDKKAQDRLQELLLANKDKFSQSEVWQQIENILNNHKDIIKQTVTNDFDEKISNPLNIIVPGWETMWRLVFYSLLELLRRPELLEELRAQLFNTSNSYRDCPLLRWILKETLRLYPPTKNIYRTNLKTRQEVRIAVQEIHRDENVWGSDALEFRPDRFKEKLTPDQEISYLPFSISCPARHGFTYAFAGAIISEILKYCPSLALAEGSSLLSTDKLLNLARNSYSSLQVINL